MNAYEFIVKMKDMASSPIKQLANSVGMTDRKVDGLNSSMMNTNTISNRLSNSMGKLGKVITGVFAIGAIFAFTNKVMDARSEYERFEAVLTNTFQSASIGKASLNMLTDFAEKTPFQLNDLTGSFVKLVNRGINPTQNELRNIGDLASSQGKGFDQLVEGILDAQTGEFERLKEFGIKASKSGDLVSFSFKGVTKTVQNNEKAISKAILEYGKMKGVAGSMDAIAGTMGGQLSNLKDKWNGFLVAIGGESGAVFSTAFSYLSLGIETISKYIPYIYQYFSELWSILKPVVSSLREFLSNIFDFDSTSSILKTFGSIMTGVLVTIDLLSIGLSTVIGWLAPFADYIMYGVGAWYALNLVMAVSPLGWIVMGIMAIITVIGMVVKYTDGWGASWKHTVNGAKFLWQAYSDFVSANFNTLVNTLMIGIDKIKLGWYSFKDAVGMGDSSENQKMIAQISSDVEMRKKSIQDGYKKMIDSANKAKNEFSQVGITVDTDGIKKDFNSLKDKFSNLGANKDTSTKAYDDFVSINNKNALNKDSNLNNGKGKDKKDSIVSGGSKITHININIEKLQDDTKIYVDSTEKGLSSMGEKVQEMLLRAVNSVNQMQTN